MYTCDGEDQNIYRSGLKLSSSLNVSLGVGTTFCQIKDHTLHSAVTTCPVCNNTAHTNMYCLTSNCNTQCYKINTHAHIQIYTNTQRVEFSLQSTT